MNNNNYHYFIKSIINNNEIITGFLFINYSTVSMYTGSHLPVQHENNNKILDKYNII